ncbi:SSRD protein, partial [Poecile atricapillus]|nr:SSRD protein [Poecile atricapillus]
LGGGSRVPALPWVLRGGIPASPSPGEPCPEPTIAPSYYTTSDAVIASESVFVVEISLVCKNGAQNVALYADVNGKQFPVTRGQDVGRYQVSFGGLRWVGIPGRGFEGLRWVGDLQERLGELFWGCQVSGGSLGGGAWNGPWVSTEVVAAAIGLVVYYLAFSTKSSIQA